MASFSKFSIISYSKNLLPVKYIDIPFLEHIQLRSPASLSRVPCRALTLRQRLHSGPAATGRFRSPRRAAEGLSHEGKRHPIRFARNHPGEGPLGYRTGRKMLARMSARFTYLWVRQRLFNKKRPFIGLAACRNGIFRRNWESRTPAFRLNFVFKLNL